MKFACVSDTHGKHWEIEVPPCDVFIHCGDYAKRNTRAELLDFAKWMSNVKATKKIYVPGNHDKLMLQDENQVSFENESGARCLAPDIAIFDGFDFWGCPYLPVYANKVWPWARTAHEREDWWKQVPTVCDILVTHCPPLGILDNEPHRRSKGCESIRAYVERFPPRVHCFGHKHNARGVVEIGSTKFINCAAMDRGGKIVAGCVEFELDPACPPR